MFIFIIWIILFIIWLVCFYIDRRISTHSCFEVIGILFLFIWIALTLFALGTITIIGIKIIDRIIFN